MEQKVTASVTDGSATWTSPVTMKINEKSDGYAILAMSGTWAGTVRVQASVDGGATYLDLDTFTEADTEVQLIHIPIEGVLVRAGSAALDWTSGTIAITLVR